MQRQKFYDQSEQLARSVDAGGRPMRQYELCNSHAEQVAERERGKGRQIIWNDGVSER